MMRDVGPPPQVTTGRPVSGAGTGRPPAPVHATVTEHRWHWSWFIHSIDGISYELGCGSSIIPRRTEDSARRALDRKIAKVRRHHQRRTIDIDR